MFVPTTLLALLALQLTSPAAAASPPDTAYRDAVGLIDGLYLRPAEIEEGRLLHAAARQLSDRLHWLVVGGEGDTVTLRHGDGSPIGEVSVGAMATLPEALLALEEVVIGAGHDLGDVDVRLEILDGMTDALDRYSRVQAGDQKSRFDVRLKGTVVGVGVTLAWVDGELRVTDLVVGGPADLSGLRWGDTVLRIDGKSVGTMPVREAERRLEGEEGTQVVVQVRRSGEAARELAITRAQVIVENVQHQLLADGVGYVKIDHVSQKTLHNLVSALDALRLSGGLAHGLVIDLRGNTGGSMKESARVADVFVDEGLLLRTVGRDGARVENLQERMDATLGGEGISLPVALVVDERTASGAEILAGALVELDRAVLVGTRTFGKGSVQKLYPLGDDVDLKLTVAQYLLANDRAIDELGLVPDAVVGRIDVDGNGVRYHDFDEGRQRTPWDRIVPWVTRPGSNDAGFSDLPLEIARRTVLTADAPTREAGRRALDRVVAAIRVEEEGRLAAAMEQVGLDWSPGETDGGFLDAEVTLTAEPWEGRHDVMRLVATVRNPGTEPLHRALVQLGCWSLGAWDDVVVPVGRVPAGGEARGEVAVALDAGLRPREDVVEVRLRAAGLAPLPVGEAVLATASAPAPELRVAARLVPDTDGTARALVTLINEGVDSLYDVEVRFAWPGDLDVEILDHAIRVPVVRGRDRFRADFELKLGEAAPAVLPLQVHVESARYSTLLRWPLDLPVDGRTVALSAPRVSLATPMVSAPSGPAALPLVLQDEGAVDHVVVYAGGEKVAWYPGGRGRVAVAPEIELGPGVNLVYVEATDDDGLLTVGRFAVRGEPSVDAATDLAE